METVIAGMFGLIIGSFLNAAVYRLEQGGSLVRERSRCPKCGHILSWYELVPLASFALQRGRCRACTERISWQYPAVELACGLVFVWVWQYLPGFYRFGWEGAYLLFVSASLLLIFVFDLKHYIIPNRVMYPLILAAAAHAVWGGGYYPPEHPWWSALGVAGFFLFLYLISRGTWIGFGDVKFGVFMGLFLGFPGAALALFFSYVLGALVGLPLVIRKDVTLKSEVPFGPFLIVGSLVAFFWGRDIIQWYLNIM